MFRIVLNKSFAIIFNPITMKYPTVLYLLILILCLPPAPTVAQSTDADRASIKAMTGCYRVTFDYAETFSYDTAYGRKEPYHAAAPAEWVFVAEETDDKIVLQHLLVISDSMIIKHWRQDWLYEHPDMYSFDKDRTWKYVSLPENERKGRWMQKVFQVDDSPRYEQSATWVHVDGKDYWESTAAAPLPRREFSKRDDYNVLRRTNRHILTDYGWLHEQDNLKIIRDEGEDSILVGEKGLNKYYKIDEKHCQVGKDWWENNQAYWALVRQAWEDVFERRTDLKLRKKVDDTLLWQALFELGDEYADTAEKKSKKVRKEIDEVIARYIVN